MGASVYRQAPVLNPPMNGASRTPFAQSGALSIRKLIKRIEEEFRRHGYLDMRATVARISKPQGGYEEREVEVYYLN